MPETPQGPPRNLRMDPDLWATIQQAAALEDLTAAQLARRELRRSMAEIMKRHKKGNAQ